MNTRLATCVAVVLLSACAKPAPSPASEAAAATEPPVRPAPTAPAPAPTPAGTFSLDEKGAAVAARGPETPVLVAVRTAAHDDFDRLVFEFDGDGLPQWRAQWVEIPITDCGSGQVVPVSGTAWLQVRFSGAAAHTPAGKPSSGPRQRRLRHPVLRDLARTCDFEGEVTWVAGLAARRAFRTDTLSAPSRLVIDIAH